MQKVLLNDEQVEQQRIRWVRAIKFLNRIVPLWHYHGERLKLTMCRGWNTTAAVDGIRLYWNPEFTQSLTDRQLRFLLVHEVSHVMLGHLWRGQDLYRDETGKEIPGMAHKFNVACDYAIHALLFPLIEQRSIKSIRKIESALYDVKYDGLSAEEIFGELPDDVQSQNTLDVHILRGSSVPGQTQAPEGSQINHYGDWVLVLDGDGNPISKEDTQPFPAPVNTGALRHKVDAEISVLQEADGAGWGTGGSNRKVTPDLSSAKEDWTQLLARFMVRTAQNDYSYARPDRGALVRSGIVMPTLRSPELKGIVAIDTSGSINQTMLNRFLSEVELIREQIGTVELEVIPCDDEIPRNPDGAYKTQKVSPGEMIERTIYGGGGTAFKPVFDYIETLDQSPAFLIYFTDGKNRWSDQQEINNMEPGYPVLWVLWPDHRTPKWGEIIKMTV